MSQISKNSSSTSSTSTTSPVPKGEGEANHSNLQNSPKAPATPVDEKAARAIFGEASETVAKQGQPSQRHESSKFSANNPNLPPSTANQGFKFDSTKVAIDRQITNQRPLDATAEAMREATDGDSEESIQRKMLSFDDETQTDYDPERVEKRQRPDDARERRLRELNKERSKKLHSQEDADKVSNENVTAGVRGIESNENSRKSHDTLMLLSSKLDRNQTASLIATKAAQSVQMILQSSLWERDVGRGKRLAIGQLSMATPGARTTNTPEN